MIIKLWIIKYEQSSSVNTIHEGNPTDKFQSMSPICLCYLLSTNGWGDNLSKVGRGNRSTDSPGGTVTRIMSDDFFNMEFELQSV